MSSGDFAIGLLTIITGLAIVDMVTSLHGVLTNRLRVRWDWLAMLAALFVFLVIVCIWGLNFRAMANQSVNPRLWFFALQLAQVIPMYLAARASLPDAVDEQGVSLADHYARFSRYLWAAVAVTYVNYIGFGIYYEGPGAIAGAYFVALVQLLLMLVLVAIRARGVHALLVPAIFVLFCYDHLNVPMFG